MRSRFILALAASMAVVGCTNMNKGESKKGEEEEGDEVKMAFTEVPAPVQATLKRESNNAQIDSVDKEGDAGKTIYEADVMLNGANWELRVAPDGTLVSKKVDNEADEKKGEEKGEKKDKDEDEEHEKHAR